MGRASQGEVRGLMQRETQGWGLQGWRFLGGERDISVTYEGRCTRGHSCRDEFAPGCWLAPLLWQHRRMEIWSELLALLHSPR